MPKKSKITKEGLNTLFNQASDVLTEAHIANDAADYNDLKFCLRQLVAARKSESAFRFILAQIQYHKEYKSPVEALEFLIKNVREKLKELKHELTDESLKDSLNGILATYDAAINQILLYAFTKPGVVFSGASFRKTFNRIFALCHDLPYKNVKKLKFGLIASFENLMDMYGKQHDVVSPGDLKKIMLDFVEMYFDSFYLSKESLQRNIKKLMEVFPEDVDKLRRYQEKSDQNLWNHFVAGIVLGVGNRETGQYPWVKLNKDRSVSLFLESEDKNVKDKDTIDNFELAANSMEALLRQTMAINGIKPINPDKPMLEIIGYDDITEYKLNIAPEDLDTLFKHHSSVYGYRGENSVMKLCGSFSLKEGSVMLCPVLPLDEHCSVVRGAGCQLCEMPTIQLLHLLPNYDGKDKYFHWVPDEVMDKLAINSSIIQNVFNAILKDAGIYNGETIHFQSASGDVVLSNPSCDSNAVRMVDMDKNSEEFYAIYGNIGKDELQFCKSLEVSLSTYLTYLKKELEAQLKRDDFVNDKEKQRVSNALLVIDEMMMKQNKLADQEALPKLPSTHSTVFSKAFNPDRQHDLLSSPEFRRK